VGSGDLKSHRPGCELSFKQPRGPSASYSLNLALPSICFPHTPFRKVDRQCPPALTVTLFEISTLHLVINRSGSVLPLALTRDFWPLCEDVGLKTPPESVPQPCSLATDSSRALETQCQLLSLLAPASCSNVCKGRFLPDFRLRHQTPKS
jgi:hypothetical protein